LAAGEDDMAVRFWAVSAGLLVVTQLAGLAAAPLGLPSNLDVSPVFQPFLDRMWQSSPTFRHQCRRLGRETGVRVTVLVEDRPGRALSLHARTVLARQGGLLVSARVYLKPGLDAAELIAHEIEHILEQLDGVDLKTQAGGGAVWKTDDGAFETRRAIEAGQRVAQELRMGPDAKKASYKKADSSTDLMMTVMQKDVDATPLSPRSSRVSGNGRFVVFTSSARLVDADRNQFQDVYVLNLATAEYTLESAGPGQLPSNNESLNPGISRNGRFVVFESAAGNLTGTPFLPGTFHVFLRDRTSGATRLLTTNASGQAANSASGNPAIDADATAVVFESSATDLIATPGDVRHSVGIYLIQLASGRRTRLDVRKDGGQLAGWSMSPSISADGRYVAFVSTNDLTCGLSSACIPEPLDKNGVADIYICDTQTNIVRRITRSYDAGDPDGPSYDPAISGDGRHVAFVSEASNLTRDSIRRASHIYVHDLATGITELVSRTTTGRPANGASLRPALSHDGSRIAFQSLACNLVCERKCHEEARDINLLWDVFVYDRSLGETTWVSRDIDGAWMDNSRTPSLDDAGHVIAFGSSHPIDAGDEGRDEDVYVYRVR
jgi:Tol biopolymer transport system component